MNPEIEIELNGQTDKWKVINDSVHGHFKLHPLMWKIIDTVEFQRLRFIKQLSLASHIFPGATHTRFEHSLGVCHLAGKLLNELQKTSSNITNEDIICVQIAGLCHDLGHGPFSHTWEKFIHLANPGFQWKHEVQSVKIFKYLLVKNDVVKDFYSWGLTDVDIQFICELINPQDRVSKDSWSYSGRSMNKAFLYEVVANKRNGLDVDKWDYFLRDSHHLGLTISFDCDHLIPNIKVIDVPGELPQLGVRDKECHSIFEMFYTRLTLHSRAYQHPINIIIQTMLLDALQEANKHLEFTHGQKVFTMAQCVMEEDLFISLTDSIMTQILFSNDPQLDEAKNKLRAILLRKFYWIIGSVPVRSKPQEGCILSLIDSFLNLIPSGTMMERQDLTVEFIDYNFGLGDKNPLDEMKFFQKSQASASVSPANNYINKCYFLPSRFREVILLLICKRPMNPAQKSEVNSAFEEWSQNCISNGDEAVDTKGH